MTEENAPTEEEMKKKVVELRNRRKDLVLKRKKLKNKLARTEEKLSKVQTVKSSGELEPLPPTPAFLEKLGEKFSENDGAEIVVEERNIGHSLSRADVFLLTDNGAEPVTALERNQSPKSNFLIDYIEDEVEPAGVHGHGNGIEHRVWRIGGRNMRTLGELISSELTSEQMRYWEEYGLQGIKKLVEHMKKLTKFPLSIRHQSSMPSKASRCIRKNHREVAQNLKDEVLKYAQDNDLTVKEAMVALQMKDDGFSDSYEWLKNQLWKTAETWESAFELYLRLRSED